MKQTDKYLDIQITEPFLPVIEGMEKAFASGLNQYFAEEEIATILDSARGHFENARRILPNVGPQSPWLKNLLGITYEIGLWKELLARGLSLKEVSVFTQQTLKSIALRQNTPEVVEKIGRMLCSRDFVEKIASYSHLKEYPEDWIFDCVLPLPDDTFQIGMDIRRCPIGSLCHRLQADAFFPYLCLNDYVTHGMLGIELHRTRTLAHGAGCCDFRLRYHGKSIANIITTPEQTEEFRNRGTAYQHG